MTEASGRRDGEGQVEEEKSGAEAPHSKLVAGAAATAAAASAREAARGRGGFAGTGRGENGKLDRGFLAGALGAGDFLLLVDDNLLKALVAVFADVFVNGHCRESSRWDCNRPLHATSDYNAGAALVLSLEDNLKMSGVFRG